MNAEQIPAQDAPLKQPDVSSPPVAETPKVAEAPHDSNDVVAMARREKALRRKNFEFKQQMEAERKALAEQKQELESIRQWKARLSQDPISVLNEAGVNYDTLTNQYLNQPSPELMELRREIQALKAKNDSSETQFKRAQEQQYEQAKKQIRTEVDLFIDSDDSFEVIRTYGDHAKQSVVDWIEDEFQKKGYVMPIEQAAKEVEEHILKQNLAFAKLKKVQARLNPAPLPTETKAPTEPKSTLEKIQPQQQKQISTLSNSMTPSTKSFTEKERIQRAILRAQGIDPDSGAR